MATLSRDTANAHQVLENNFNKDAIRDKLEIQQQETALGTQAVTAYMDSKLDAARKQAQAELAAAGQLDGLSEDEIKTKVEATDTLKTADKEYGIGSTFWTTGTAATGAKAFALAIYGKGADELAPDEKMVILNLVAALGAAGGGAVTGDTRGMVSAGNAARVEVENNNLSPEKQQSRSEELIACNSNSSCKADVREKYAKEYDRVQEKVSTCSSAEECIAVAKEFKQWKAGIAARSDELTAKIRKDGIDSLTAAEKLEWINLRGASSNFDGSINTLVYRAKMFGGSEDTTTELANIFGHAAISNAAGVAAGIGKAGAKGTEAGQSSTIVPGGGLAAHEKAGGHLIDRHVGKSEAELFDRVSTGNTKTASTFTDRAIAEAVTSKAIDSNQTKIKNYLSGSQKGYLELDYQSSTAIGISVTRGSTRAVPATNARIIIGRDPSMPDG